MIGTTDREVRGEVHMRMQSPMRHKNDEITLTRVKSEEFKPDQVENKNEEPRRIIHIEPIDTKIHEEVPFEEASLPRNVQTHPT